MSDNSPIDGGCERERDGYHVYRTMEVHTGCTVMVGECDCGKTSLTWHHGPPLPIERYAVKQCEQCMSHFIPS